MLLVFLHQRLTVWSAIAAALCLVCAANAGAQPIGPSQPVTLEHADSFIGRPDSINGGNVIEMKGHVVLIQGVVRIEADNALLFEQRNHAVFTGNVRMTQPEMVLTAPRAEYDGTTRIATAPSGVTIVDKGATLRAGAGDYNMYDRHAYFRNGVVLNDGKSTMRATAGEYLSVERRANFSGGVDVENDSGRITAREMTYWRDTRETYALGSVVITPKKSATRLTGDTLRNRPNVGYTVVTGRPKLVQIDSVRSADSSGVIRLDTTVITSMVMEAFRGDHEEYVATDSVKMVRGDLQAVAGRARYIPGDSLIALGAARTLADTVAAADTSSRNAGKKPDTTAVTGGGAPAAGPLRRVGPLPVVWYQNSQLIGDTITIHLAEKKLRTIDVERNAFAISEGKLRERYDQLAATRLIFDVDQDTIRFVHACELASSIYFVNDQGRPSGVNRASGDTIIVAFDSGQASTIEILGRRARAEGEYFPEKLVVGQEGQFRLAGFRWYDRDGSLNALNGTLPRSPSIPDVKQQGTGTEGTASQQRR